MIPAAGPVAVSLIRNVLGGPTRSVSMSLYYAGTTYSVGIPATGLLKFSDFKNLSGRTYPPVGLTSVAGSSTAYGTGQTITGQPYGNGVYQTLHSTKYLNPTDFGGWRLFQNSSVNFWGNDGTPAQPVGGQYYYDATTGYAKRSSFVGTAYMGEYAIMHMPVAMCPTKFRLFNRDGAANPYNRSPLAFRAYGSNDGSSWTLLYANEAHSPSAGSTYTEGWFTFTAGQRYRYFGIIINRVKTIMPDSDLSFNIGQLQLWGTNETI